MHDGGDGKGLLHPRTRWIMLNQAASWKRDLSEGIAIGRLGSHAMQAVRLALKDS